MNNKERNDNLEFIIRHDKSGNFNMFAAKSRISYLFKFLRIADWTQLSKFIVLFSLFGIILFVITLLTLVFLQIDLWVLNWIYLFVLIIVLGFAFSKPDKNYNYILVLLIFIILIFVPSNYGQFSLQMLSFTNEGTTSLDANSVFSGINIRPLQGLTSLGYFVNDVCNYIIIVAVFILCGGAIGDLVSQDYGEAAKSAIKIAMCILVISIISTLFTIAEIGYRSPLDTLGETWSKIAKSVGLAQLDQKGNAYVSTRTVISGVFSWIPFIFPLILLGVAVRLRHSDYESLIFTKSVVKENVISVETDIRSSPFVWAFALIVIIYTVGYFLITAKPEVVVDPLITIVFYVGAIAILILLSSKLMIINADASIIGNCKATFSWFMIGIMGLFLWFQVFQPTVYNLGLTDHPTGLATLSQNESILESDYFEQLFLVAVPETLIFQIAPVGLGNRIYFTLRKGRILKREEKRLETKIEELLIELSKIKLLPESISAENLRRAVKVIALRERINTIKDALTLGKLVKVQKSYFILPTLISASAGSFLFSWYHSFRRGIDFIAWWQNPMLGMVYFGAGYYLCVIAFFSYPAAILIHWINNLIACFLAGG